MEKFLQKITKEAGELALEFFKKEKNLTTLRGRSKEIVTKYDKLLDNFLIKKIKEKYPKDNLLTEESGFLKGSSDYLWVVDSLDGSSNFANKNPLFSISLALMKKKKLICSSIFAPAIGEFYFAQKGKGAFLNGKRIEVSKVSEISQAYILFCDGAEKKRERITKLFSKIFPKVKELRKIGSAGIELGWVASGRAEAFFVTRIDPWDVAAGVLLIREAGGKITDFLGNPWHLEKHDLLFSNKKLHQEILDLING